MGVCVGVLVAVPVGVSVVVGVFVGVTVGVKVAVFVAVVVAVLVGVLVGVREAVGVWVGVVVGLNGRRKDILERRKEVRIQTSNRRRDYTMASQSLLKPHDYLKVFGLISDAPIDVKHFVS